jgi:polo-like kinase 1
MASRSSRRSGEEETERATIIEEKVVKVNGDVTVKRYSKGRFLGKGGFARVYEFMNLETRKITAAKIVPKASLTKSRAKQKLMSEIKIHRSLHHPNIVNFEHFFEDAENVYILLELCTNQTMNELLRRRKRLTELEVQCYLLQIISALKYLHSHRVIHRDLKLGNLFLSDKIEIKIGDLGLATKLEFDGERKRTICGTPNYIAPEVLDGKQGHSYEVDIWSFGVIAYTLLVGKPPFETSDVKTTYRRIRMNAYSFPDHVPLSDQSKSFITRILVSDPSKRPNLDELLAHEFFHQGNSIPKLMPSSTLACPPSSSYLRQFLPNSQPVSTPQRMVDTAPANPSKQSLKSSRNDMFNTERLSAVKSKGDLGASEKESKYKVKSSASSSYNPTGNGPEVWVKKWVDYSSKYGLGYLLSNGATGVFFNDSSKIILSPNGHKFHYMERRGTEKQDIISIHFLTEYPKELQKKVTLLQHFRSYLEGDVKQETGFEDDFDTTTPIYVKKWMRTRHAIMFRLSNKIVQVNFQDHTEIILSSESRMVTYVNKKGERNTYPLNTALESTNVEMSKRLKYTKDILTHMLGQGAGTGATTNRAGSPITERQK